MCNSINDQKIVALTLVQIIYVHNKNIAKNRNKLINKYILTKITDLTRD